METKEYVYLWVLDFNDAQVYKYNIEKKLYNEEPECCEDYMQRVGHEISNVQWMVSPYDEVLDENNGWDVADKLRTPIDNNNVTNKI
jgi:hypothetical protein